MNISQQILEIELNQSKLLENLSFHDKISYIYNPIHYAYETHAFYVHNYCCSEKLILFLGMNPGPFGMAQNGIPFGDSYYVNNWLQIKGNVMKPLREHPKREIQGLNCSRSEVSGNRFWSFFQEICGTPENFFRHCYVHNYCPISMMTETAKNITPADLKAAEKKSLITICDASLCKILKVLNVKYIVGVGNFAKERAEKVVKKFELQDITVTCLMHPSPINPAANKGWSVIALNQLKENGILQHMLSAM